uniref:Uncharacterized protein n=1 Tax=Anguilla anguilla TaxID=7936 RepID=A0A0E9VT60_ANGAN
MAKRRLLFQILNHEQVCCSS